MSLAAFVMLLFVFGLGSFATVRLGASLRPIPVLAFPAIAFAVGFAVWAVAASIGYLYGLHLGWVAGLAVVMAVLLGAVVPCEPGAILVPFRPLDFAALIPAFVFAISASIIGPHNTLSADTIHHLIYVENFARSPFFEYARFELSSSVPRDLLFSVYAGNAYHALVALPSLVINGGGEATLRGMNGWTALLLCSAVYGLTYRLAGEDRGALAGFVAVLLAFLLFLSCATRGFDKWIPTGLSYPNHFGAIIALASITLAVRAMEPGCSLALRFGTALVIGGCVALHLQWFLYCGVVIGIFAALQLFWRRDRVQLLLHNLATVAGLAVAVCAIGWPRLEPYLANAASVVDASTPGNIPMFVVETAMGRIVNPSVLACPNNFLAIVASLAVLVMIALQRPMAAGAAADTRRNATTGAFAFSVIFFALLLVTPVVTDALMAIASPVVVGRMTMMLQCLGLVSIGVAVAMAAELIPAKAAKALPIRNGAIIWVAVATLVSVVAFVLSGLPSSTAYWEKRRENLVKRGYLPLEAILDDSGISGLLSRIPQEARLLLVQPDIMKEIPLIRTGARMVQPVYALDAASKDLGAQLAPLLQASTPNDTFSSLIERYRIDTVVVWDWEGHSSDTIGSRPGFQLVDQATVAGSGQSGIALRLYTYQK